MPLLHITLLYLPAKIIFASGNFKHALYPAACNLHAQLQHDQTRCCREKIPIYVARLRGPETANIRSRMLLNYIESRSVYTNAPLSRPLCSAPTELWTRHSDRAAGLKRLSAILRSCLEERRRRTRFFPPANPRNALAKVSFGEMTKRESLEFKSSGSASDRSIPDYLRLIRLRRCSIIMDSIRAITDWQSGSAKARATLWIVIAPVRNRTRCFTNSIWFSASTEYIRPYYNRRKSRLYAQPTFSPLRYSFCRIVDALRI